MEPIEVFGRTVGLLLIFWVYALIARRAKRERMARILEDAMLRAGASYGQAQRAGDRVRRLDGVL